MPLSLLGLSYLFDSTHAFSFSLPLVSVLPFVILSPGVLWLINTMVGLFSALVSIQIRLAVTNFNLVNVEVFLDVSAR